MRIEKLAQFTNSVSDETGSATVSFAIWVPLLTFLLTVTASISFVYLDAARMENAARTAVHRISLGQDTNAVAASVAQELPAPNYRIDASCTTTEIACIKITRPSESVLPFVRFSGAQRFLGENFGAEVRMRREPGAV